MAEKLSPVFKGRDASNEFPMLLARLKETLGPESQSFRALDRNKSNYIEQAEFIDYVKQNIAPYSHAGPSGSADTLARMFALADQDQDGRVSFADWQQACRGARSDLLYQQRLEGHPQGRGGHRSQQYAPKLDWLDARTALNAGTRSVIEPKGISSSFVRDQISWDAKIAEALKPKKFQHEISQSPGKFMELEIKSKSFQYKNNAIISQLLTPKKRHMLQEEARGPQEPKTLAAQRKSAKGSLLSLKPCSAMHTDKLWPCSTKNLTIQQKKLQIFNLLPSSYRTNHPARPLPGGQPDSSRAKAEGARVAPKGGKAEPQDYVGLSYQPLWAESLATGPESKKDESQAKELEASAKKLQAIETIRKSTEESKKKIQEIRSHSKNRLSQFQLRQMPGTSPSPRPSAQKTLQSVQLNQLALTLSQQKDGDKNTEVTEQSNAEALPSSVKEGTDKRDRSQARVSKLTEFEDRLNQQRIMSMKNYLAFQINRSPLPGCSASKR